MQFSSAVKWTLGDFAVAGALLLGAGFFYEFAASRTTNVKVRRAHRARAFSNPSFSLD